MLINLIHNIINEGRLFYKDPISYIWLYTYSKEQKVVISPYDPKAKAYGQALIKEINTIFPDLKIHFLGSTALEIPGQNDLDFYIEYPYRDFNNIVPQLSTILGEPNKKRRKFIEWIVEKNNFHIELVLIDPDCQRLKNSLQTFEKLYTYRKAYAVLKNACNGMSEREYAKHKLIFITNHS